MFCDHSLKRLRTSSLVHSQQESTTSQELLRALLAVATAKPEEAAYSEIAIAARSAMSSTLGVMSAPDFVIGILTILNSASIHVRISSLNYLFDLANVLL